MKPVQSTIFLLVGACLFFWSGKAWAGFTEPTVISQGCTTAAFSPEIEEGPDGTLHALWSCRVSCTSCGDYQGNVAYSTSNDGGTTWSAPRYLTNSYGAFQEYTMPRLAIGKDGVLYLVYYYINYFGSSTVYYAKSSDNGLTWSQQAVQRGCFAWYPEIASGDDGGVFMAWDRWQCGSSNRNVYFRRSLDNGQTWSSPVLTVPGRLFSTNKSWANGLLIDSAGQLHMLVSDQSSQVADTYIVSPDSGASWSSANVPSGLSIKNIARSGDILLLSGEYNGGSAIFSSADNGASWLGPFTIADRSAYGIELAVDTGSIYYSRLDSDVFRSNDGGITWSKPSSLASGWSFGKMIVTSQGELLAIGTTTSQVGVAKYVTTAEPDIAVEPASLDFGPVELPGSSQRSATISNAGNADLEIRSLSIGGSDASSYSFVDTCTTVPPNGSCKVTLQFAPATIGAKSATLDIASTDTDMPVVSVPLSGTGTDTIAPATITIITGRNGNAGWYLSDVTVSLSAADAGSGVKDIHYTLDGTETVVSGNSANFTITTDGTHTITYFATDKAGNAESTHPLTIKIDKTPPVLNLTAALNLLWPPNHKMVAVTPIISVSDNLDTAPRIELVSVTSNEPDNGLGDGDTSNDIVINGDGTISLRAERSGAGSGRVYTMTYQAADIAGNTATASVTVTVPHNQGR